LDWFWIGFGFEAIIIYFRYHIQIKAIYPYRYMDDKRMISE